MMVLGTSSFLFDLLAFDWVSRCSGVSLTNIDSYCIVTSSSSSMWGSSQKSSKHTLSSINTGTISPSEIQFILLKISPSTFSSTQLSSSCKEFRYLSEGLLFKYSLLAENYPGSSSTGSSKLFSIYANCGQNSRLKSSSCCIVGISSKDPELSIIGIISS